MIEILRNLMIAGAQLVNGIYNIELEYRAGATVKYGEIMLGFAIFFILLYWVFRALGIFDKGDD